MENTSKKNNYCKEYHQKHRDEILIRKRKYYQRNKSVLNEITVKKHYAYTETWKGYIPEMTQCQMCGVDIFFHKQNQNNAIHFDHRKSGTESIKSPMAWLSGNKRTPKNQKIWEECNFGMLCGNCNKRLPTIDRKKFLLDAIKYVFGFKVSYSKLDNIKVRESRINGMNSGKPRTGNPEPSLLECKKVQRLPEDSTLSLITGKSVPIDNSQYDIVRYSKELEKTDVLDIMPHHKGVQYE